MSRWHDNFENHAFQPPWKEVNTLATSLKSPHGTIIPNMKELARLKKIIKYIDELLSASDAELIPESVWNNFLGETNNVLNQIKQFEQNNNYTHLIQANKHLDNLLSYISPYIKSGKGAARAAGLAFKAYSDVVNNHIELLKNNTKTTIEEIHTLNEEAKSDYEEIEATKENIDKFKTELLIGYEDEKSLKEKLETLETEASEWHSKIDTFHQDLTSGDEEESSIILQIEEAKTKAINNSSEIEDKLEESNETIRTLTKFYNRVFGEKNESGELTGGLKLELELRNKNLDDFKEKQEIKYRALNIEIESLLPGATSAGLAAAYNKLKETFDKPIENATRIFYASLFGLLVVGLFLVVDKVGWLFIDFKEINEPIKLLNNLLYKLPITAPLIWLAIFASKRRSESRRLQQEYAHKEALAKSYESYKKQIESLGNGNETLLKQLLEAAIKTVSFNASTTLDGKHGDKVPLVDDVESLLKLIKELRGEK